MRTISLFKNRDRAGVGALVAFGASTFFIAWMILKNTLALLNQWCSYNVLTGVWINLSVGWILAIAVVLAYLFITRNSTETRHPSVNYRLRLRLATFFMLVYVGLMLTGIPMVYVRDMSVSPSGYVFCIADQPTPANYEREHLWHQVNLHQLVFGIVTLFTCLSAFLFEYFHEMETEGPVYGYHVYDSRHEDEAMKPSGHGTVFHLLLFAFMLYFLVKNTLHAFNLWCNYAWLTGFWIEMGVGILFAVWAGLMVFPGAHVQRIARLLHTKRPHLSARHMQALRILILSYFAFFFMGLLVYPLIYYADYKPGTGYQWCLVDQVTAGGALVYGKETLFHNVNIVQFVGATIVLYWGFRALAFHLNPEIATSPKEK